MAAIAGAGFDQEARTDREQAVGDRLRQPPGAEARQELGLTETSPPPSRWSLRTLRASVASDSAYRLSGLWRLLQRLHLRRRLLRDHLYSPDAASAAEVAHRERCLREAARWPAGATDWTVAAPGVPPCVLHKAGPTNRQ